MVHSLTARSVSRQFREGLKQAQPHAADINIKLKTALAINGNKRANNNCTNNNNKDALEISNEQVKNTANAIVSNGVKPGMVDGELNRKKSGSSSNILARAAFWDKRVTEGIVDDELVIREFPKMEI